MEKHHGLTKARRFVSSQQQRPAKERVVVIKWDEHEISLSWYLLEVEFLSIWRSQHDLSLHPRPMRRGLTEAWRLGDALRGQHSSEESITCFQSKKSNIQVLLDNVKADKHKKGENHQIHSPLAVDICPGFKKQSCHVEITTKGSKLKQLSNNKNEIFQVKLNLTF